MSVDFKALLSKPLDDVKRPPALPAGLYFGNITKFEFVESRWDNKETGEKDPMVKFDLKITHADGSVDPSLLTGIDLTKRKLSREMPVGGGNEWVTKQLIESLGIATAGRTFAETIPEAVNAAVMFEITSRPNPKDPDGPPFNDVRSLRPAHASA